MFSPKRGDPLEYSGNQYPVQFKVIGNFKYILKTFSVKRNYGKMERATNKQKEQGKGLCSGWLRCSEYKKIMRKLHTESKK